MTFGEMKAQVANWMRESVDDSLLSDAVNDAIESLSESIITVKVEQMMGGPVSLNIAAASERTQLVSIVDPVAVPVVSAVAGGTLPGVTLNFYFTYVTESGSETNVSPVTNFVRALNNLALVAPPAWVAGAVGWNLYANLNDGRTALQNSTPLDFGNSWQEPEDTGVVDDPDLPSKPLSNTTGDNIFYIEHLELQMPDTTFKAWNAADLDSELMRRAARTIASSTPYQNYYWDLINGQTLEMRPAAGQGMVPRYFYVAKPRRIKFDNAPLPLTGVAIIGFLRYFAISLLKLAFEEYQASTAWDGKAEKARMEILKALTKTIANKNNTVTPYMY